MPNQTIPQTALTGRDAKRSFEINLAFELRSREREEFIHTFAPSLSEERRTEILESDFLRRIQFAFKTVPANSNLLHLPETQLLGENGHWLTVQRIRGNNVTTEADYQFVQIDIAAQKGLLSPSNAKYLDLNQEAYHIGAEKVHYARVGSWAPDGPYGPLTWLYIQLRSYLSNAFLFDPFRHSTDSLNVIGNETLEQDGSNLAQVLHTLNSNRNKKFREIEAFIQTALPNIGELQAPIPLGSSDTRVAIESPRGYSIYLREMGGGVEQLLMVATVLLTTTDEHPLFLEEPEGHLHAGAQRFLIEKLYEGERQVFITTHSPTFINLSRPHSLYQVKNTNGQTNIIHAPESLDEVLEDIGVRNSDVFLSDAVLFVEGKSDREVLLAFSRTLKKSFAERNINILLMDGGRYASRGAPIRSDLLTDFSQKDPVPHLFVLDRDERKNKEVSALEARFGDRIHIFKGRELENYLLVPRAILCALRAKHASDKPILELLTTTTEQDIEQLIQSAANDLYGTVLIKRIRAEIGSLRDGLLSSDAVTSLVSYARSSDLPKHILDAIKSVCDNHITGLDIDTIVSTQKEELDRAWSDPQRRLQLAPGEEILDTVFKAFHSRYRKSEDALMIATQIQPEEIDQEIRDVIEKAYTLVAS